jgi:hypothetical protein
MAGTGKESEEMSPEGIKRLSKALKNGYQLHRSESDWVATSPDSTVIHIGINEWCAMTIVLHTQGISMNTMQWQLWKFSGDQKLNMNPMKRITKGGRRTLKHWAEKYL